MQMNIMADDRDVALLAAIEDGLPFCETPYAEIGRRTSMDESEVLDRLRRMNGAGIIRRFGLVLQHRPLGYRANAMVVFNIPDNQVNDSASKIIEHDFVSLCYCRTRHQPAWNYNLYCMIHGRERTRVEAQISLMIENAGLESMPSRTLFSRRRFKQTGARFSHVCNKGES